MIKMIVIYKYKIYDNGDNIDDKNNDNDINNDQDREAQRSWNMEDGSE